eukprot:SM000269S09907  [mRNA]  locus=s269:18333:21516:- [translate_table: standard]
MGSTLGACGDVNRNVLAPPVPLKNRPEYMYAAEYADKIAWLLAPQAGAYYDVWLDGEKVLSSDEPDEVVKARMDNSHGTNFEDSPEPIYGQQFLPRKFKIAITVPGDNSIDILTNDIGLVVMTNDAGELEGFNIYVGGGMGRTHRKEQTFPALAQPLGFVPKDGIYQAVKAIVATQRDNGRRDDRSQARMKYLIHSWGIERFRAEVEKYYGGPLEPFRELPPWKNINYVGWGEQGDGLLYYSLHIDSGRLKGDAKKTIREVVENYDIPVSITANQNLVLCDIKPSWKTKITKTLAPVGILGPRFVDTLNLNAMACPALPLCGLAITEAERGLPDLLQQIRGLLNKVGLKNKAETMVIRMTGCPNGCARPYMAELGFVGDGPNSYQIWLGGHPDQTNLAEVYAERVKVQDLEKTLEPLFYLWKTMREKDEAFGPFTMRVGFEKLRELAATYDGPRKAAATSRRRVQLPAEQAEELAKLAEQEGVSAASLAAEAISLLLKSRREVQEVPQ